LYYCDKAIALTALEWKSPREPDLAPHENRETLKNTQAQQLDKAMHITTLSDALR
jgi:hypothetical protein